LRALSNLHWFLGDHERALRDLREGIAANPANGTSASCSANSCSRSAATKRAGTSISGA
jgi:hypothetical protein